MTVLKKHNFTKIIENYMNLRKRRKKKSPQDSLLTKLFQELAF
jgi:hypothetical protein